VAELFKTLGAAGGDAPAEQKLRAHRRPRAAGSL
jgi:hypothetical protein